MEWIVRQLAADSTNVSPLRHMLSTPPHVCVSYSITNGLPLCLPNISKYGLSVFLRTRGHPNGTWDLPILLFILYKFLKNKKLPRPDQSRLPPGPRPWPVIGNLNLLGHLPHHSLSDLAKKYGHIVFLRLGSVPTVVVSSPAMAREFLKTHDLLFANRPDVSFGKYVAYDRKNVGYAPYGEYWRKMRKLCTIELFTAKRMESFKSTREEEVFAMVRSISLESEQGMYCVNVKQSLSSLTQNIVCRMFSSRTYSNDELSGGMGFKEMISEISAVAGAFCIGDYIPFLDWFDLQGLRGRMHAVHKIFDGFAEKVIDDHIECRRENVKAEEEQGMKDMVDVLLDMAESESQEIKITRLHIKAVILDILSAGVETPSTTIEWAMSELIRNPHVMAKAQQEIESVVGRHHLLKECDVASLEYLRCVVKETFRLHPPVPLLLPHESMGECSVNGYYIPPKTMLFVNIWAMGRDDSVWDDPLQFNPERFMEKKIDVQGQDFELLPFGTGRRGCPAISMGLSIVEMALSELIHCFDWSVEGELNMDEIFGLTIPKKFPLCARPSWRLTSYRDLIYNAEKDV